jgi:hypothetical protein
MRTIPARKSNRLCKPPFAMLLFGCFVFAEWFFLEQMMPPEIKVAFVFYSVIALLMVYPLIDLEWEFEFEFLDA